MPLPRGENHYNWKGGKKINSQGYVLVRCDGHPRAIASQRYTVREHILVMEKHLGRYLRADEIIHHINGNKADNRLENLLLTNVNDHMGHYHRWGHREEYWKKYQAIRDPVTGRFLSIVTR